MTDWSWIQTYKDRMGNKAFKEYVNSVYKRLMEMKVGDRFSIDKNVRPENTELFIKIGCMFIREGFCDYEFSNDYKSIIRHESKMDKRAGGVPQGQPGEKNV
jgi:hypothetical protein